MMSVFSIGKQQCTGLLPVPDLAGELIRVFAAILLLFGAMFATGGFLLPQSRTGWVSLTVAVLAWFWLRQMHKKSVKPMPRPGLDDDDNPF